MVVLYYATMIANLDHQTNCGLFSLTNIMCLCGWCYYSIPYNTGNQLLNSYTIHYNYWPGWLHRCTSHLHSFGMVIYVKCKMLNGGDQCDIYVFCLGFIVFKWVGGNPLVRIMLWSAGSLLVLSG